MVPPRPQAKPHSKAGLWALAAVGALALAGAVWWLYGPASGYPFVFDDQGTIVDNLSIRRLWPPVGTEEAPGPLCAPRTTAVHGRPLVNLSFAVNYALGGLNPIGYRHFNMAIHLVTALLLWAIVTRTLQLDFFAGRFERIAGVLGFASALVWALHPVNTESVVYVTQRTESMMGMFYLATLYSALHYWSAQSTGSRTLWLITAATACIAGMLCKEMAASAPAMCLLYERTFLTGSFRRAVRRSWPLYAGLLLSWFPVIFLNFGGPRTPASGFGRGVAAYEWWLTQTEVFFLYLKLAVWPWPLVIHYQIPYLHTFGEAWPWVLSAATLAFATCALVYRQTSAGFVATWFVAVLSPTLVIPLVNEIAAERRLYVPLAAVAPFLIAGGYAVVQYFGNRFGRKALAPTITYFALTASLAVGFAILCSHRLASYRQELFLWQDAVRHQPEDPMAQFNLGTLLAETGRIPEAIPHLEAAVRLDSDSAQAQFNLARALEQVGQSQKAFEHYQATVDLQSDHAAAHYNLARLLEEDGRPQDALTHYEQAVAAKPDFSEARGNLGILLLGAGRTEEAIRQFEAALKEKEDFGNCLNLASAYSMVHRRDQAIRLAERALNLARHDGNETMIQRAEEALSYFRTQPARH